MIFSPVHQSSPPVQSSDCRLPLGVRLCSIHKVKKHNLKIRGEWWLSALALVCVAFMLASTCTDNISHESCACVHNVPKFPTDHSAFSDCSKITILEQSLNAEWSEDEVLINSSGKEFVIDMTLKLTICIFAKLFACRLAVSSFPLPFLTFASHNRRNGNETVPQSLLRCHTQTWPNKELWSLEFPSLIPSSVLLSEYSS